MSHSQTPTGENSHPGENSAADEQDTEPLAASSADPLEPSKIEGYRIVRLLGRGGMGEVYEAEQVGAMRRRVAIKEIKRGMDSRAIVNRFEAERQALAMMDHPGIAKIFDAGLTEDHRPFFAMEYVEGVPITEYCDEHRLGLRQRIELFVQVCRAVQHAHVKGIVHRDLKPNNLLVTLQDGEPVPKVIDFGLAKAMSEPLTEREMKTELGQTLGTMEYMSPEQADLIEADVDTRTDVYSLGVVLYELLAGTLPFTTTELSVGGYFRALRRIREDDPLRPSHKTLTAAEPVEAASQRDLRSVDELAGRLEGDLDWIVMMALEKDRERRYQTVNALVDDLLRHLGDEPVVAAQPSVRYRVGKFIRRHRVGFATSTLLVILVLAFSVVMAVQAARIAEERDRANLEAATARESLDFMVGLFEFADPEKARGNTLTAREVLDAGAEQLRRRLDDQPLIRARLLDTIGGVYLSLGLVDDAAPLVEEALALREKIAGRPSRDVAESLRRMADVRDHQGENELAESLARDALALLDSMPDSDPGLRSDGLRTLGWALARQGDYSAAENVFREVLEIRRRTDDGAEISLTLFDLSAIYREQGRYAEARPQLEEALHLAEAEFGERHPLVRAILNLQGVVALAEGRSEEGVEYMRRALVITEDVLGSESRALASDLNNLALLLDAQGRFDEAENLVQRALGIYEQSVGPQHQHYGATLGNLAWISYRQGDYERAEDLYEQVLAIYHQTLDPQHSWVAIVQLDFAKTLRDVGKLDRALDLVDSAYTIQLAAFGEPHPAVADCLKLKGEILLLQGAEATARPMLERAVEIQAASLGADHPETERTREMLERTGSAQDDPP